MADDPAGIQLPQDWELIGFFEVEPKLTHQGKHDYGWQFNELTFCTQRGEEEVVCVIDPSYGELKLRWSRSGELLLDLALCFAKKLTVHSEEGHEWMEVEFEPDKYILPLRLQLKPTISIGWGVTRWL